MEKPTFRMLFFPAETFPTNRVRLTLLFGKELLSRGHAIDFVMQARDGSIEPGRCDWSGTRVWIGKTDSGHGFSHRMRKHVLGACHDLRWLWRARADKFDCILVSDKYLLASVACVVARLRGIKFFFWLTFAFHKSYVILGREGIVRYPLLSIARGHLARIALHYWVVPHSDHVFVQSQNMADDFARYGGNPGKMTPVLTGIDVDEIAPVRRVSRVERNGPLTIGYLGTLARERRLEILVDMLALLNRRGLFVKLLLVGDGETPEDRAAIVRRAAALGVADQIEVTGLLPRSEALERIRSADICVSPIHPSPIFDGASPTKLVEYLALGVPVVANSHPDQSLVLRESRAGVCVPWGARHFARAVHWLSRHTEAELAAFGCSGRAWVESRRSYSVIADQFEGSCLRAIGSGQLSS